MYHVTKHSLKIFGTNLVSRIGKCYNSFILFNFNEQFKILKI